METEKQAKCSKCGSLNVEVDDCDEETGQVTLRCGDCNHAWQPSSAMMIGVDDSEEAE